MKICEYLGTYTNGKQFCIIGHNVTDCENCLFFTPPQKTEMLTSLCHVPIEDAYEIFKEKCCDEGIEPPTFEEFKKRR